MEEIFTKEEIDEALNVKGEARGIAIKEHLDFILKEKGESELKKLEDFLKKFGCPGYKEIKPMSFYPLKFYALTLLGINKIFGFGPEEFEKMGRFNAKFSIVIRLLMKYLISLDTAARQVPKMWRRYYSVGELKVIEYSKNERYVTIRLENFRPHPMYCYMVKEYLSELLEIIVKNPVRCERAKCDKGNGYHEFLLKW